MRSWRAWGLALLLALGGIAGCRYDGATLRTEGYLFTVYSMPRDLRAGPLRLGLRVQDPDYRVLTDARVRLSWQGPDGSLNAADMSPGPGKDYRVGVVFDRPGAYRLRWTVVTAAGKTLTAEYPLLIPGS